MGFLVVCWRDVPEPVVAIVRVGKNLRVLLPYSDEQAYRIVARYGCWKYSVEGVEDVVAALCRLSLLVGDNGDYDIIEFNEKHHLPYLVDAEETVYNADHVRIQRYWAENTSGYEVHVNNDYIHLGKRGKKKEIRHEKPRHKQPAANLPGSRQAPLL